MKRGTLGGSWLEEEELACKQPLPPRALSHKGHRNKGTTTEKFI